MTPDLDNAPLSRVLGESRDWRVSEYLCRAGPADRPFEERHECFTIAAVLEGTFNYRANSGRDILHPGSLLLGNMGACYECSHEHSRGDRCISLHLAPEYFNELAATAAGSARFSFPVSKLSAVAQLLPSTASFEAQVESGDLLQIEEAVTRFAEVVLRTVSGHRGSKNAPGSRDERRISQVLRFIEGHIGEVVTLDELSTVATMSKYHFLRTFRLLVGVTPYQYLLGARMRAVATQLVR